MDQQVPVNSGQFYDAELASDEKTVRQVGAQVLKVGDLGSISNIT